MEGGGRSGEVEATNNFKIYVGFPVRERVRPLYPPVIVLISLYRPCHSTGGGREGEVKTQFMVGREPGEINANKASQ